jgi:hypothetical protein
MNPDVIFLVNLGFGLVIGFTFAIFTLRRTR